MSDEFDVQDNVNRDGFSGHVGVWRDQNKVLVDINAAMSFSEAVRLRNALTNILSDMIKGEN